VKELLDGVGLRYNGTVITRAIRDYVARDWQAARASKDAYWGDRIGRLGACEGFRVAEELRRQMLDRNPSWPQATRRAEDLQSHVRLAALLRRASPARRG
jgi:hypothetical protein